MHTSVSTALVTTGDHTELQTIVAVSFDYQGVPPTLALQAGEMRAIVGEFKEVLSDLEQARAATEREFA